MNHRPLYLAAALFLAAPQLRAEETAPPSAEAVPPYQLKKRSAFPAVETDGRAPFWPIGWVKRAPNTAAQTQVAVVPRVRLDGRNFKVTSILVGAGTTPSLAVINGRAYTEGEFLRMPKSGTLPAARVRVQRISDGTVLLQHAEQTLVASLQRPELQERRSEELLLDPDR